MEFAFLGAGYTLYFQYLKYCNLILLFLFLSSGLFDILTNSIAGKECKTSD
jgi:hypothetical protein